MSLEALKETIQKKCNVSFDYNKAGRVSGKGKCSDHQPETGQNTAKERVFMPRLTEQEQQEIVRFIEADRPLPEGFKEYKGKI